MKILAVAYQKVSPLYTVNPTQDLLDLWSMQIYKNQIPDIDLKCGSIKIFADLCESISINSDQ